MHSPTTEPIYHMPINPKTRKVAVILIEVVRSNPNGNPDQAGAPRRDLNEFGIISNQSVKRVIRDYVSNQLSKKLYITRGADLGEVQDAHECSADKILDAFWDVRTFGGVLSRCDGKFTGPFQVSDARSVHPIEVEDMTFVRTAGHKKDNDRMGANMGSYEIVPFGLYRCEIYFSPRIGVKNEISEADIAAFWEGLIEGWEDNKSAHRTGVSLRRLYVFDYASQRGGVPSQRIAERVKVDLIDKSIGLPSSFQDYSIEVDQDGLPDGMTLHQWSDGAVSPVISAAAK